MSSTTSRVWAIVKPHVPLIRFRKGGKSMAHASSAIQGSNLSQTTNKIADSTSTSALPKRFMRKPLTELEMDAIEMGGLRAL